MAFFAAFIQPVVPRPAHLLLPSHWDRDRRRDEPSVSTQPVTTAAPHATSSARPDATAIAHAIVGTAPTRPRRQLPNLEFWQRRRQAKRPASHGASFPSAILQRRCVCPELPNVRMGRFDVADGRGRRPGLANRPGRIPALCKCHVRSSLRFFAWRFVRCFCDARDSEFGVITRSGASIAARSVGSTSFETFAEGFVAWAWAFQSRLVRSFAAWSAWGAL